MHSRVRYCGLAASVCLASVTFAQDWRAAGARPYDGIQAGLDAFRLAEERRQVQVAEQIGLTAQLPYWSASPFWPAYYCDPTYFLGVPYFAASGWPVRQPIAQQQMQTGPRRWESHPVYGPPLTPHFPQPPVASPWLDNTPYGSGASDLRSLSRQAQPTEQPQSLQDEIPPPPPPKPPVRGPREY